MRAFAALQPPESVLDHVEHLVERLRGHLPQGRFSQRQQWHLTLHFLGDRVEPDAARGALAGLEFTAGEVQLGGLGAFDSPRNARVLWVGLTEGADWVTGLAGAIEERLAGVGEPVGRSFHPHVTLARLEPPTDVRRLVAPGEDFTVGHPWTADEVVLFESVTASAGARYTPIGRFGLG